MNKRSVVTLDNGRTLLHLPEVQENLGEAEGKAQTGCLRAIAVVALRVARSARDDLLAPSLGFSLGNWQATRQ